MKFNKFNTLWTLLFVAVVAMGAKLTIDNTAIIGDGSAGTDKSLLMGDGVIKWDAGTSKMQFANDGGTDFKDIGSGGGGGAAGVNLFDSDDNADFEAAVITPWAVTGGTLVINTGTPGFDLQSGSWDSSAASEFLTSALKPVPLGLEGRECNATLQYKYNTGSSGDYKFQVVDSTPTVIAEVDMAATTDWQKIAVQFTCPSSESIRIRIESTADGGILLVDNATLGQTDFVDVAQAEMVFYGVYEDTTNCQWTGTSTTWADFATDADCPAITVKNSTVDVNTTDDDYPSVRFNSLPPGRYLVRVEGAFFPSAAANTSFRIQELNGTLNGSPCGGEVSDPNDDYYFTCTLTVDYPGGNADTYFRLQFAQNTGTTNIAVDSAGANSNEYREMSWTVYKYPLSSDRALTLETSGGELVANHGSDCAFTTSSASFADLAGDATCTFTVDRLIGAISSVTSYQESSNNSSGLIITASRALTLKVCASGSASHTTSGGETSYTRLRNVTDSETMAENGARLGANTGRRAPISLCGLLVFDGPGTKSVAIQAQISGGDTYTLNTNGDNTINWSAFVVSQQMPAPVFTELQNLVKSESTSGIVKVCGFGIANAGTPTFETANGDCVDSVSDDGVGQSTVTFTTGFFDGVSEIFCTCLSTVAGDSCTSGSALDQISGHFFRTRTNGNSDVDRDYEAICVGIK